MQEILYGSGVKDKLGKLFASSGYQKAHDGEPRLRVGQRHQARPHNSILQAHKELARQNSCREPDLMQMYAAELKRQRLTGAKAIRLPTTSAAAP